VSSLLAGYKPRPHAWDELMQPGGQVRPVWRTLVERLEALGDEELGRRWERAQQLIHENGVSYNVHGDPQGLERPWRLSPVPVVMGSDDWAVIARGLEQRGRLLAALLADLYGPQRALTEGKLPPELVYANPYFLRPLHGLSLPGGDWLPHFATDVLRLPDGSFRVVEDRVQVPTGAGYALENRIVVSTTLREAFRECNVERLALFFRGLRETLEQLAPHDRDNPRIVLLTPGPFDATYFEQAYLAQYLGVTLVHGGDLIVRDDRVHLKTLGGLLPIDVILRRVNDDYCDPLELRPDSQLGVPGLVQAVRMGNVAIVNPLGTGLVQAPALLPYLADLSRQLLGEALVMPPLRTLWLGDAAARSEVLGSFDRWVLRPPFPDASSPTQVSMLDAPSREALLQRVKAQPSAFVAQEHVPPSTTPFLQDGTAVARSFLLRCYAVSKGEHGYRVMPGGLARVAADDRDQVATVIGGAGSKDVWVLSSDPVGGFSLLGPQARAVALSRGGSDLPSRAADNLYWLGRYAERAQGIARLARVIAGRMADLSGPKDLEDSLEFGALLAALRAQTEFLYAVDIPVDAAPTLEAAEAQLAAAVGDSNVPGSLASVIRATLRSGRVVRDRISMDTWRVLGALDEGLAHIEHSAEADGPREIVELLNRVVLSLAAFDGLAMEGMTRGQAWRFLDLGRRLERAVTLLTLLRATTTRTSERERPLFEAVLDIADSGMTYRRRYLALLQCAPVVDLLLADDSNPRSVIYQVRAIAEHIRALPVLPGAGVRSPQLRMALSAQNELELAEIEPLCQAGEDGTRPALEELLRKLGTILPTLSDSLSDSYLAHATQPRHLAHDGSTP
jgi:uncharacterized circularly permuted ATP-grasp superfamily protein/uncharacterized alpha-E superfamily protein